MHRLFMQLSAFFALFAVALGAIAAHALESRLSAHSLDVFQIAARYQMYHALGLGFVSLISVSVADKRVIAAGWCFVAGILVFSGSLYALALSGVKVLGAITPIGGIAFMLGWALLFLVARSGSGQGKKPGVVGQ
jgi:uncharacterized membrane protein YgdD (TMEM256/DUF423 family)